MQIINPKIRSYCLAKWQGFIERMKRKSLPGFAGIPIYDVAIFFMQEIKRDMLPLRASAMSFNFMLAIFPTIIFLLTLVPYVPFLSQDDILKFFQNLLPENGYAFLESTITDMFAYRGTLLSFGFIFAFYFSTNGVRMMMLAFNKDHPIYKRRTFWRRRGASIRLTFYLFILFITSLALIIAGDRIVQDVIGDWLGWKNTTEQFILSVIQWMVVFLLFFTGISLIYYYGPAAHNRWRFITPGATLATIATIAASLGFAFFVNNFGRYNEVYGSIGTIIVLMIWLNFNSLVLLVGFEINNSIDVNRVLRQKVNEPL